MSTQRRGEVSTRPRSAAAAATRRFLAFCLGCIFLSGCAAPTETPVPTPELGPTFTAVPTFVPRDNFYVDGEAGSDFNPGTQEQPWQTIQKATQSLRAGDILYVRGGVYPTIWRGWSFRNSGTDADPITISNYPGEQVIIQISGADKNFVAFGCWYSAADPPDWQTPKADHIRIIGTPVKARPLTDGVVSNKGIVIEGVPGIAAGVEVGGNCDNWEVAGIDFIKVGYGIFTKKRVFRSVEDRSPDHWYVHDNRVYGFYRESGMQFNGNYNRIENNEIYKVVNDVLTPYGCQMINISGNNNILRGNTVSRLGSRARCSAILLEWDLADNNVIERNTLRDSGWNGHGGFTIAGGDHNVARYNIVYAPSPAWYYIYPDGKGSKQWPCNEETADQSDIPADDPAAADYKYYYPHDCRSVGNVIYDNTYLPATPTP